MPGSMDGLQLAHAVRDRWPPIRIIVTSGRKMVMKDDLPEGGRFFAKPYDPTNGRYDGQIRDRVSEGELRVLGRRFGPTTLLPR
jgi:hypothetical protein